MLQPLSPNTSEAGDFTYVDTALALPTDMTIRAWEVQCLKPGRVQLRIYRLKGPTVRLVGHAEPVRMREPGNLRFDLAQPIRARAGDVVGLRMPDEKAYVGAMEGGKMLFCGGEPTDDPTPLKSWNSESKTLCVRLIGQDGKAFPAAADWISPVEEPATQPAQATQPATTQPAASQPATQPATRPAGKSIRLFNASSQRLRARLFDLATRQVVADRTFESPISIDPPPGAEHLFLIVTPI